MADPTPGPKPERRRYQFRLRTLILFSVAIWLPIFVLAMGLDFFECLVVLGFLAVCGWLGFSIVRIIARTTRLLLRYPPLSWLPKRSGPWYQFSLRSLLVLVTLACVVMGILTAPVSRARRQRDAIAALRKLGWIVTCDPSPVGPAWARKIFGNEMFMTAVTVDSTLVACDDEMSHLRHLPDLQMAWLSSPGITDAGVKHVAGLRDLEVLCLSGTSVSNASTRHLSSLENLKDLYITRTRVTEDGENQLRQALPNCNVWKLKTWTNSIGMEFVLIPKTNQALSEPASNHEETHAANPFYLGVFEVTQRQYEQVTGKQPCRNSFKSIFGLPIPICHAIEEPDRPVVQVSWDDAVAFCEQLSELEGQRYRLPTEAEWVHACNAATDTRFSFGNDAHALGHYAWFEENAEDIGNRFGHTVGQKKPNGWGLHDMYGNVWEYCSDWASQQLSVRYRGSQCPGRVFRGGDFTSPPEYCGMNCRGVRKASNRNAVRGFRVVATRSDPDN